jgi:hypothetical protein
MSNAKASLVNVVKAFTATVGLILVVGAITASAQTSQFVSMMRNARVFFADGTAAAPSITFASQTGVGFRLASSTGTYWVANSGDNGFLSTGGVALRNDGVFGWSSTTAPGAGNDTILCRGAANVIGIGSCTSSGVAWKRSTTHLIARLGDDSANTDVTASFFNGSASSVISSGTTIAPTGNIHHISGTTAIATITVPAGCTPTCSITLIPDGLWTTTTAGNISLASTAVVNKALILAWDGTKWNPSY